VNTRTKLALSLTVVSTVLGCMATLQYRRTEIGLKMGVEMGGSSTVDRRLVNQLNALKAANNTAEQTLANVTGTLMDFEKQSTGTSQAMKDMQTRLEDERILAGVTPVTGPGVTVTLMDGAGSGSDVEQVLTHDWNVRSVMNEMFTAGAEAMSINGYRVVATSAVTCQGPVVTVNNHRLGAPFKIEAIGDPSTLQSALTIQGGILDLLRANGLQVSDPQIESNITMPAFTGALLAGNEGS
jgi:uncharacterized protein YlxW (UPF0749 family)